MSRSSLENWSFTRETFLSGNSIRRLPSIVVSFIRRSKNVVMMACEREIASVASPTSMSYFYHSTRIRRLTFFLLQAPDMALEIFPVIPWPNFQEPQITVDIDKAIDNGGPK